VSYVDIANEWPAVRGLLDRDEQARASCWPGSQRGSNGGWDTSAPTTHTGRGQTSAASATRPASSAGRVNMGQWPESMST
jgi:hypothetical protein